MRICKFLLTVCAATLCAGFISVRAQDNPAQAAARAALEQKMHEAETPQAATNMETAPPVVVTPSGAAVEQPAQPTNAPMMTLPTAVPATEPPTTPVAPEGVSATNVVVTPSNATVEQMPQPTNAPMMTPPTAISTPIETPEPAATMPATNAVPLQVQPPTPAPEAQPVVMEPVQPPKTSAVKEPGLQPVETPALPISMDKQAQLQALLEKYKADQITPAEYQSERAKILAGP
jgi:hypothetical protein